MKILGGTYLFNEHISCAGNDFYETVEFVAANTKYTGMGFINGDMSLTYYDTYAVPIKTPYVGLDVNGYGFTGWEDQAYRTVTFDNQSVTDDFYNWVEANAEMVEEIYSIKRSTLKGIADSIREKKGTAKIMLVGDFSNEIKSIERGISPSGALVITENGAHDVTNYSTANVQVETQEEVLKALIERSITHINVPVGTSNLGPYAFSYARQLVSITIPEGVGIIDHGCFYGAEALTEISLPNSVGTLAVNAFAAANKLEKITIGSGLKTINNTAFHNCYALKAFICCAETPPTLQANSFFGVPEDCVIYVPADSVDAYKTATNWSDRAEYVKPITDLDNFLCGTYIFNETVNLDGALIEQDVNFTSNGRTFSNMTMSAGLMELFYDSEQAYIGYDAGWMNEAYRTVTFAGFFVSEEFYNWFMANATEVIE
jgi:hypothetical protein